MAAATEETESTTPLRRILPRKRRWRAVLLLLSLTGLAVIWAWMSREQIAGNVLEAELDRLGLPATYDIVSIGPQQQRLRDFVVGDPDRPDLTIEEVIVNLEYGFGTPTIGRIELVRPRLFGTYVDGIFSLGALDPVVFAETDEPPGLPDLNLAIVDGRALIESDLGPVGIKLDGAGPLDSGFAGKLAATAPGIGREGCEAQSATLYGDLTTNEGSLAFSGPVRLRGAACEGAALQTADIGVDLALTDDFAGVGGSLNIGASELEYIGNSIDDLSGEIVLSWTESGLNLQHDLTAGGISSSYASLAELRLDGSLRSDADFDRSDWSADATGSELSIAGETLAMLDGAQEASEGTLLAPLLSKFERNFASTMSGGRIVGSITARQGQGGSTVVVPEARMVGRDGEAVLALSRISWTNGVAEERLSGNFVTGGPGLPRINGRMEQSEGGALALRMAMAEYSEGSERLAIPRMQVLQSLDGSLSFTGAVTASGAIPGGSVAGLELPLEGRWSEAGGLILGSRCSEVRFEALTLSELDLRAKRLALCPQPGRAMVRYDDALQVDLTTRDVDVSGELAGSPALISAGSATLQYPGGFQLADVAVAIGADGSAVRLTAEDVTGDFEEPLGGRFASGTAMLDIVPLDLSQMDGRWAYRDETLIIDEGAFTLTERIDGEEVPFERFEPLIARDAMLTLAGSDITAQADLLNPGSGRLVTAVDVVHDLGTGEGRAKIDVPGVVFDDQMRPEDLTYLAKGVVAYADGIVTGEGDIRWTEDEITSTGSFSTDNLDLAAAFGPIDGIKGTVEFTDLIALTTAPGQVLEIGALNPGIEVLAGQIRYSMTNGTLIAIEDARWPFMGGELILRPVTINYGEAGPQRYVFEIIALDAATFIAQMELSNIGATGTFDGTVPIEFDDQGNGTIEAGLLISRQPGGNVSYIGELTYEDMGAMANFAFQSLRSLDYRQMSIGLDGSLAGEIITNFQIDGVRQGEGASRNFVTRRLAKLPIRFNINVRSQNFYQLATMVRSFFDPEYLGNPIDRGLLDAEGGRLVPANPFGEPRPQPGPDETEETQGEEARRDDELAVQPPESDNTP